VVSNLGVMWSLLSRDIGKEINKDLSPIINQLFDFLKENRAVIAQRISKAIRGIITAIKGAAKFAYEFRKQILFIGALGFLAFIGKMALALKALGKAFFLVGNKGLLAWLKMIAPLVLLGAAVTIAYLALQDLWTAIFNPEFDSFTKRFLEHVGAWEKFRDVVDWVKEALRSVLNTIISIGRAIPEFFKKSQTKGGKFDLKQITRAPREKRSKEGDEAFVNFLSSAVNVVKTIPGIVSTKVKDYVAVSTGQTPAFAGAGAGTSSTSSYENKYYISITAEPGSNGRRMANDFVTALNNVNQELK